MANELENTIRDNANGPARASDEVGSMEQHSLPDQIAAAKFIAQNGAAKRKDRGIRFSKLRPGGAD